MNCGYERELRWRDWQGLRILELTALPAAISPRLNYELLSDCMYQNVSVQFSMLAQNGKVRLFLLLRANELSQNSVLRQLESAVDRTRSLLGEAGFLVQAADLSKDRLAEQLLPCYSRCGALYFAEEKSKEYYAPAAVHQLMPLDWIAIARVLSRAQHAVFSLHLMPTFLSAAEKQIIRENCTFFEEQSDQLTSADAPLCAESFQKWQTLSEENLFFMAAMMHGDESTAQELASVMHRIGLTRQYMPMPFLSHFDDLLPEALILAEYLAVSGHTYPYALPPVMSRFSHLIPKDAAAAFSSFPQTPAKMTGVRVNTKPVNTDPLPDALLDPSGLHIGCITERGQDIYLPPSLLPLHAMIVGMPGMGKTTYAIGLLHQLHQKGYPFLVLEPTKTEYRALIDCIHDLRIYTAGRSDICPMSLNPFIPPKGVTLEQFKPSLISVFMAAFSMTSPLDVIFPDVVNECYARYGWRNNSTRDSKGVRIFGLHEFICVFRESIRNSHYDADSKANIESGGAYRLQALLNANPTLFDTDHSLPYDMLLEHPTLIELDAIDNQEQKALIISIILINLMLVIRNKQVCDGHFKNLIMVDEAHLLLGQHMGGANEDSAKSSQSAVQMIQNLIVTIRAYGTGLIFADQSPQKLTAEVVNNCNFKTIFHLDGAEDRNILAQNTGLTEKMVQDIRTLTPGEAYIGCSKLNQPVCLQTPHVRKLLNLRSQVTDEELRERAQNAVLERPFAACADCVACKNGCSPECRSEAEFLAHSICLKIGSAIHSTERLKASASIIPNLIANAIVSQSSDAVDKTRLRDCTRIHLLRRIRLTSRADTSVLE